MSGSPRSDDRGLPTCCGGSVWIDSISAKRAQFEGAGVEAIDKIFVRRLGIVGVLDSGRVLAAADGMGRGR
jgi:hypothetical protein